MMEKLATVLWIAGAVIILLNFRSLTVEASTVMLFGAVLMLIGAVIWAVDSVAEGGWHGFWED